MTAAVATPSVARHAAASTLLLLAAVAALLAPSAAVMEVIVVPHSHCDAGWLYTADRYFYNGTHKTGSVFNIITTVVDNLAANPSLRFVWAETIWLAMWWEMQTPAYHDKMKAVVVSGQVPPFSPFSLPLSHTPTHIRTRTHIQTHTCAHIHVCKCVRTHSLVHAPPSPLVSSGVQLMSMSPRRPLRSRVVSVSPS
jgi:hypothetical protein